MFLDHAHIVHTWRAYACNGRTYDIYIYIYTHIYQNNSATSVGLAHARPNYVADEFVTH